MIFPLVSRTATQVQSFALTLLPHGGQGAARRNAWTAMSVDATQARSRREADLAMHVAVQQAQRAQRATS